MNKNIIVTMIAGAFFAASAVGPAFAGDGAAINTPQFDLAEVLPDLQIEDRLRNAENIAERIGNLDVGTILDKAGAPSLPAIPGVPTGPIAMPDTLPDLAPVDLPKVDLTPELEPLEPPEIEGPETVPEVPAPLPNVPAVEPEELPAVEPEPAANSADGSSDAPGLIVKELVEARKAEKAAILAAHNGDRRAAKAELKAAQMRMVEQIKANNGAGKAKGKAKGNREGKNGKF